MTGNNIVDIKVAATESNWKRTGFLEKIFTQKEQEYIKHAATPDEMVWKLWSMKESAYKIYTRQYGGRFFAPKKLSCTLLSSTSGQVTINTISYQTITSSTNGYIYTTARQEKYGTDFLNYCCEIHGHFTNQQKHVYKKLVASYAANNGEDNRNFTIIKDKNNVPFMYCKKEQQKIPVSITHHGNFAAFTIN